MERASSTGAAVALGDHEHDVVRETAMTSWWVPWPLCPISSTTASVIGTNSRSVAFSTSLTRLR